MSLNPIQFGEDVISQFTRYLLTYFPIADQRIEEQVRARVLAPATGERMLVRGPYIQLNRSFEQGPRLRDLLDEPGLGLHPALPGVFSPIDELHKHQELALRAISSGKHTVVATGTGSGKTESFLLPIVDHCLKLRDEGAPPGVVAVLVYPMNALVNDQLDRLRRLLCGTGITFGRYTGETPEQAPSGLEQLAQPRLFSPAEIEAHEERGAELPLPFEECYSREAIRTRRPRILLTNYSQLELLLLRDRDLDLFRDAPLRFLVFDEVHTYTGSLGAEVACLIRRLRYTSGKGSEDVIAVGTSATVQDPEGKLDVAELTVNFMHRLFGVDRGRIELVQEQYKGTTEPSGELYDPARPQDACGLLEEVLEASREVQLQDEPTDIPPDLLQVAERLCGRAAPAGQNNMERLHNLLACNTVVRHLTRSHDRARPLDEALQALATVGGRSSQAREDLVAELLCYLTLGALAQREQEPLLRPKIHYFVQGYQGMWVSFEPGEGGLTPRVYFSETATGTEGGDGMRLPLLLCRACGQHYFRATVGESVAANSDGGEGYRPMRVLPERTEGEADESIWYLTDSLHTEDEENEAPEDSFYMCRYCGSLHEREPERCLREGCGRVGPFVRVRGFMGEPKTCAACGAPNWSASRTISGTSSAPVQDVMILAQSMLTAMQEPAMRKLLVFADNRQDAAFQAGWMEERSKRLRLRHLLYRLLEEEPQREWGLAPLTSRLLERAQDEDIIPRQYHYDESAVDRVRWFLLQEFASRRERRGSLETLGLARVDYAGLTAGADAEFFDKWALEFGISKEQVVDIVHLVLDYHRRRGALSDPLLTHWWGYADPKVRDGIVQVPDHWAPSALTETKDAKGTVTRGFLAASGVTAAQEIVGKSVRRGAEHRDAFLRELWAWLTGREHEYLVQVDLTQRKNGRLVKSPIKGAYQINAEKISILHTASRHVCSVCRQAQGVAAPTGNCPAYRCRGKTSLQPRDNEHFAVVQYTELPFVPLRSREHTAQVSKTDRAYIEDEFKKEDGQVNCIVCTPTLELGVDIGKLEMVLMRNVPPAPANYAQRAGRAGRKHRIAVVFAYCSASQHDRYFFEDPPAMITGSIRVPAFSMRNGPLIRKHVHSAVLSALRRSLSPAGVQALATAFPHYIWAYFGQSTETEGARRFLYNSKAADVSCLGALVAGQAADLDAMLRQTFAATWPEEDAAAVAEELLGQYRAEMGERLQAHVDNLFRQVSAYRSEIKKLARIEAETNAGLTAEQKKDRERYDAALAELIDENQENYSLSYLSNDGFLPGYALGRDTCVARCLSPWKELSRPSAVALREFTPATWTYADRNVFRVYRIDFHRLLPGDSERARALARKTLQIDPRSGALCEKGRGPTEGGDTTEMPSLLLGGVELRVAQRIDDTRDSRRSAPFDIRGNVLDRHDGGWQGSVQTYDVRYYRNCHLLLANLGTGSVAGKPTGFPVCPGCGATRHPGASELELDKFRQDHKKSCSVGDFANFALHVELTSDVLIVGPFANRAMAVNAMTGLLLGSGYVLDTESSELDGIILPGADGVCEFAIYDPVPGGSGFLPLIARHWATICERAVQVLSACPSQCATACYSCLKHYRNQQHHPLLDRATAIEVLTGLTGAIEEDHPIPATTGVAGKPDGEPESNEEGLFVEVLKERRFPEPPEMHYRVELGAGELTVPDFAWPEDKIAVYIDGMSEAIHGSKQQQLKDTITRAKLQSIGWRVVAIPATALRDTEALAGHLAELAVYLGRVDLVDGG